MKKNNFKDLLTDLYNIYNPANINYIDDLVEKYNRLEFDALKSIFIKYNRNFSPYYNETFGTDEHIYKLIKEYETGSRSLENIKLQEHIVEKPKTNEKTAMLNEFKEIQEAQEEVKNEVDKKIKAIEKSFDEKEQSFRKDLEILYKDFEKKVSTLRGNSDDVTIRIFSNYTNSELELPNKKIIAGLGKGSRLIVKDKDGKIMGMEINNIIYDSVSEISGKPLVEIFLDKV